MSSSILKVFLQESFTAPATPTRKCEYEHFCHKSTQLFTLKTKQALESRPSCRCQEAALEYGGSAATQK